MDALILYEDASPLLRPFCDLRAAFELRTGALTTAERITEQLGRHPDALIAPQPIADLLATRHTEPINRLPDAKRLLIINGRWTRIDPAQLPRSAGNALVDENNHPVAALLDRDAAESFLANSQLPDAVTVQPLTGDHLLRRPWNLLEQADAHLETDLATLAKRLTPLTEPPAPGVTIVGDHDVLVGRDAVIHPHVVFDTSAGPIAIDNAAEIRSMSVLVGPGYIGARSVITNHAHIRGHCVIGPVCKVGGEVNGVVFQARSNKAHAGYLGNSYVGEWVNLGAETTTSNLKNTYGSIRMQTDPLSPPEPTGLTHLGSIIADHVKTAIGTRLLTGSCIHTGAMIALSRFPPKLVTPFAFLTDQGADLYDLDRFCAVAEAMMSRRGERVSPELRCCLQRLHDRARQQSPEATA